MELSVRPSNLPHVPALPELIARHGPTLVLDAASTAIQVGVLRPNAPALWQRPPGDAGHALFAGTQAALASANLTLSAIGAFVYCSGPGSMLGIRTVAMTLRTWQVLQPRPAHAYHSLALAAHHAWSTGGHRELHVIADARRDSWHLQSIATDGTLAPLRRVPTAELPPGEILQPENFRAWSTLPRAIPTCSYDLGQLFTSAAQSDFFQPVDAPDAYQTEAPEYRKWTAQPHSASTAPRR